MSCIAELGELGEGKGIVGRREAGRVREGGTFEKAEGCVWGGGFGGGERLAGVEKARVRALGVDGMWEWVRRNKQAPRSCA